MGREIRRVPPDWQHPKEIRRNWQTGQEEAVYRPLLDQTLGDAQAEWDRTAREWTRTDFTHEEYYGARPAELYAEDDEDVSEIHRGTPQPYRSRAWTPEEATAFQVYETVSEGTPVSPVLPTREAVVEWAVSQGHSRTAAETFAESGYAPTMVIADGQLYSGIDAGEVLR